MKLPSGRHYKDWNKEKNLLSFTKAMIFNLKHEIGRHAFSSMDLEVKKKLASQQNTSQLFEQNSSQYFVSDAIKFGTIPMHDAIVELIIYATSMFGVYPVINLLTEFNDKHVSSTSRIKTVKRLQ
jgi:hypothetical protein